jgi:pimeloyl-ACP methyl ester carboxylesterase
MWEPVVAALPTDWHVVTYDVRGSGRSSKPTDRAAYRIERLIDDLVAVLDETLPAGEQVHLVGHDWGSIALWDAVAAENQDPRLQGRLASYTSCSGPPLDHLASSLSTWSGRLRMAPQSVRSWYVWLFQLPWLPERALAHAQWSLRPAFERLDETSNHLSWGEELRDNAVHSIGLYRANILPRLRSPRPWRTSLPVQLVVATGDAFVTPRSLEGLEARCRDLTRVEVDEGHWVPRARPTELAALVEQFVRAHA